ncbi:MAG: hypothetical protein IPP60_13900 [Sphingobacteriales bacterium]|nr:hypothetical protein [Sphingobacteriales bacterium]
MDEITIPYHLVSLNNYLFGWTWDNNIFIVKDFFYQEQIDLDKCDCFLVLYLFIVGMATFDAIYYQLDLNHYDLNKDGMFWRKRTTNEQNEAMRNLTSDTGRNFSFITGFVFA